MSFEIIATNSFERKLKRLAKKYDSLKTDLMDVITQLEDNPRLGIPIGKECYKVRVAISSKGRGKSGGARLITYLRIQNSIVFLMDIYDKSEQTNITAKELQILIDSLAE